MDGALNIKERIIEDAKQEADRIIEEAKKRADKIIEAREAEAHKNREVILKKHTKLGEEQRRKMLSAAHMDIRKRELSVKLNLIDRAFEHVFHKVKAMSDEEYDELILNMLLGSGLKGDEEIIFPEEPGRAPRQDIIEELNKSLKADGKPGKVRVADHGGDFAFGFVIRSGGVEMNSSFEAILNTIREDIEPEVATILFHDELGE